MRKWEDIVKDKLEEPEGILPKSVFAEFRSRRAAAAAPKRQHWVWWVLPAIPPIAAAIAIVLFLDKPSAPTEGVQVVPQPSAPVAVVTEVPEAEEFEEVAEVTEVAPLVGKTNPTPASTPVQEIVKEVETPTEVEPVKEDLVADTKEEHVEPQVDQKTEQTVEPKTEQQVEQKFEIVEQPASRKKNLKVGAASGIVGGGGLLAAAGGLLIGKGNAAQGGTPAFTAPGEDKLVGNPVHYFPVRVGLSVGIPVARRWFLSTGLDYSLYLSSFNYQVAGKKTQAAHYLGIPVRMNWVIASNQLLDVYVGAGVEGDMCLGAREFNLSLQGVGGIQVNVSRRLGIYLEPELGWRIPTGTPALETYRTQHPLMFSLAAGLRLRIGN